VSSSSRRAFRTSVAFETSSSRFCSRFGLCLQLGLRFFGLQQGPLGVLPGGFFRGPRLLGALARFGFDFPSQVPLGERRTFRLRRPVAFLLQQEP